MTVGIRGMGLIGGSFEKAFRLAGHEVVDLKRADADAFASCSLVVVCLPPLLVAPWIREHADDFAPGTIVVDAAGIKGRICADLADLAGRTSWTFVGGHPMAGKERSGYAHSDGALFQGASMILTPAPGTPPRILETIERWLRPLGFARFTVTTPEHHDEMIAYTSQLAHVVSSAYVRDPLSAEHRGYSAGSYQDMTRVATVDPDIWTDLFLGNRGALERILGRLIERLEEYRDAIHGEDAAALRRLLAEGRAAKDFELGKG